MKLTENFGKQRVIAYYLEIIDMFYLSWLQWKWYASIRENKKISTIVRILKQKKQKQFLLVFKSLLLFITIDLEW